MLQVVPGRNCDGCAMCCKLPNIDDLKKPQLGWCPHCVGHSRCGIYEQRPDFCRDYYCEYLLNPDLDERWKPSKSKLLVSFEADKDRVVIHVDPARPDAWRKEPFYSQIRRWGVLAPKEQQQVIVWEGRKAIAVLPNREKDLGEVRVDQLIISTARRGPSRSILDVDAIVVDEDDPRAIEFMRQRQQRSGQ
jgi:hypothetical protein